MLAFVVAILSMLLKDSINTVLTIAESRGKARLAGGLAAVSDLAGILVTVTSAGVVITNGWTLRTVGILIAIMISSAIGTYTWTRIGQRVVGGSKSSDELSVEDRLVRLERLQTYVDTDPPPVSRP